MLHIASRLEQNGTAVARGEVQIGRLRMRPSEEKRELQQFFRQAHLVLTSFA